MRKVKQNLWTGMKTLVLFFLFLFFLFPVLWVFLTSIKRPVEQMAIPPVWFPEQPVIRNYLQLFDHPDFVTSLTNSILIAGLATLFTVAIGAFAAYSMVRFRVGGGLLPNLILTTRMIPPVVVIIPIFLIAYNLNLLNTHFLLIITYTALNLALVIWLLRDFVAAIPVDIEEAAMLDGCTRLQTIFKVVLPIIKPGLVATSLICFIFCWNEFIFALTLSGDATKTMPVLTSSFVTQRGTDRGVMSAAGMISSIPVIVVTIFFQKYLVSGLTSGSVK
ncbi:carbohydrate ABC transporter permease [Paenibacillus senegalensis]|uniref:carbohydrate ABC transporter permease n=1 Tax=Paenibacillus senegalensis TaxID=1465766 RepID=UPI0004744F0A|nr:carbohydrate ABC transporter permease [Paenibacillus senegalensis]